MRIKWKKLPTWHAVPQFLKYTNAVFKLCMFNGRAVQTVHCTKKSSKWALIFQQNIATYLHLLYIVYRPIHCSKLTKVKPGSQTWGSTSAGTKRGNNIQSGLRTLQIIWCANLHDMYSKWGNHRSSLPGSRTFVFLGCSAKSWLNPHVCIQNMFLLPSPYPDVAIALPRAINDSPPPPQFYYHPFLRVPIGS